MFGLSYPQAASVLSTGLWIGQSHGKPFATLANASQSSQYHPETSDNAVQTILIRAVTLALNPKPKRQNGTAQPEGF
jgi:hypothetical protein